MARPGSLADSSGRLCRMDLSGGEETGSSGGYFYSLSKRRLSRERKGQIKKKQGEDRIAWGEEDKYDRVLSEPG